MGNSTRERLGVTSKGNETMERTYVIYYWTENEFGDFTSYHSINDGETIESARDIADSYRAAGYRVKVETAYSLPIQK